MDRPFNAVLPQLSYPYNEENNGHLTGLLENEWENAGSARRAAQPSSLWRWCSGSALPATATD